MIHRVLTFINGFGCQRRRTPQHAPLVVDHDVDDDWEIVNHASRSRARFVKAVRRVMKILFLRRIHSQLGSWLNTSISRTTSMQHKRRIIAQLYASWPRTVLSGTAALFNHLVRRQGRLAYARPSARRP